ncbi:FAD:protein FMN transferase [Pelagibius sp. CAU 1746]|uniref:FAD:protein FMN transferase n=1 Tax=Pelagibius sp. CAU 1746 TaxID=3140370 RepID=UPI00325AF5F7
MTRTKLNHGGVTRRRFIAISAAVAGAATGAWPGRGRAAAAPLVEWRGVALGAAASLRLAHPDPVAGRALLRRCVDEIERLERIFSLYREESALCRLNRDGALEGPPLELVELLSYAGRVSALTGGAFDVTIQPLWLRLRRHFQAPHADPRGPRLDDVLPLVDWRGLEVSPARLAFARSGMAVTLNGIAQGYITDRVGDLLRDAGMTSVLIDLGEIRALGSRPDGAPWRVGLSAAESAGGIARRLDLSDAALATSGGYGLMFDAAGRYGHLLDPRNGRSVPPGRSVSVVALRATVADAASTALSVLPDGKASGVLKGLGASAAYIQSAGGTTVIEV